MSYPYREASTKENLAGKMRDLYFVCLDKAIKEEYEKILVEIEKNTTAVLRHLVYENDREVLVITLSKMLDEDGFDVKVIKNSKDSYVLIVDW